MLVAQHGAWRELGTLLDLADPDSDLDTKLRVARDSTAMLGLSPGLGIGRGAFIDVFGPFDSQPSHVLHTHLESGPATFLVEWGPMVGGGLLLGAALGYLGFSMLKRMDQYQVEILVTLAMVTGGYALAQHLHISGPLAMVVAGLMMGVWFLATSVGNFIAGKAASFYEDFEVTTLLAVIGFTGIGAAILMALLVKPISRMLGGQEELIEDKTAA